MIIEFTDFSFPSHTLRIVDMYSQKDQKLGLLCPTIIAVLHVGPQSDDSRKCPKGAPAEKSKSRKAGSELWQRTGLTKIKLKLLALVHF